MGSNAVNTTRQKRQGGSNRRWVPRPLVLPADEVTFEPAGDWPEEIREYLVAYARTGSRTGACRLIGRSTDWAYRREAEYGDELTREENRAYMAVMERIHDVASTQALEDDSMPGTTMRIFLLKGAYPERFSERQKLEHSGNVAVSWLDALADGIDEADP